jgi:hypothetical protein
LIASVNRNESPELAEQVVWLATRYIQRGLVGVDLAGNEAEFKSEPFYDIFREAKQAGLHITIHAGEWGPAANVREAIEKASKGEPIQIEPGEYETILEPHAVSELLAFLGYLGFHALAVQEGRSFFSVRARIPGGEWTNLDLVAINDLTDTKTNAHLLKYDSVMSKFYQEAHLEGNYLVTVDEVDRCPGIGKGQGNPN